MLKYCFTSVLLVLGTTLWSQVNFELAEVELQNHTSAGGKSYASITFTIHNSSALVLDEPIFLWFQIDNQQGERHEINLNLQAHSSRSFIVNRYQSFPTDNFHLRIHAESPDGSIKSNRLNRMVTYNEDIFSFTVLNLAWEHAFAEEETEILEGDELAEMIVYNFLTPNRDGKNDLFIIENVPIEQKTKLSIYSIDGQLLYQNDNYQNDWAGTLRSGETVAQGQVLYIIEVDNKVQKKGYITIDY